MSNSGFSSTRYYEREWRDVTPGSRNFEHHRHFGRLFDDPFFRRMPFSTSLESLRTTGLNGIGRSSEEAESKHSTSYSSTTNSHRTEERIFADDKDRFIVILDLSHFTSNEIRVKVADDMLVIEAGHDEKKDEHGFVTRSLKRRYPLPKDIDAQNIVSELSKDGLLTVKAPKISVHQKAKERAVPVQIITGEATMKTNGKKN